MIHNMFNLRLDCLIIACHNMQRRVTRVFDYLVYTIVCLNMCLSIFSFHIKDLAQSRKVSCINIFSIEFC